MSSIQSSPLQVLEDPLYATSLICMGEASQNNAMMDNSTGNVRNFMAPMLGF